MLLRLILVLVLFIKITGFSQTEEPEKYTATNKGKVFFSWGGNRGYFSKSNIRFKGDNYNFEIKDATAKDKPKGWHKDYITPSRLTIPQTNAKIGWFVSEKYTISLGLDHMKYVLNTNKNYTVDGVIDLPDTEEGSTFNGVYNNESINVTDEFIQFEHTDGLNYIYVEFARYDDISSLFGLPNTDKFQINLTEGLAAGVLLPRTNATLLLKERYDEFHLSGYGISAHTGLNFTFFKHFFMQLGLKGGFINMPDIRTTQFEADSASQSFFYLQTTVAFGGIFRL